MKQPWTDGVHRPSYRWAALLALVAAVWLAWANSFSAPFELDDDASIRDNVTIRDLGSFAWLRPPGAHGETVGGRPMLNLSLAIDHAIGGFDVRVYRATNVLIHLGGAMLLFGLAARLLRQPTVPDRFRPHAPALAFTIALLWAVHPVQTQAVTYVVQRAESLMAFFYLATLYAFVRAAEAGLALARGDGFSTRLRSRWLWVSGGCCVLGMATKENMVSAPIAVWLFDRAFLAGSFAAAWRRRRGYYVGLLASWILLGFLLASTGGNRGGSVGFDVGVSWGRYVLTQVVAMGRYVALSFWPQPLVFEYGDFFVSGPEVLGAGIIVGAALLGTVYALWRHPKLGSVAALAWMILAPTSLVPGTLQMIVEHRMYLPLASIITFAVLAVAPLLTRRVGCWVFLGIASTAIAMTSARNATYRSSLTLWQDTVAKRPENPRAHNNLGLALQQAGRVDDAVAAFRRAISLQPNHAFAHANLGSAFVMQRRWAEAVTEYSAALTADPHLLTARLGLATVLEQQGRKSEAIEQYQLVLREEPASSEAAIGLASLYIDGRTFTAAIELLQRVIGRVPESARAHLQLGRALEAQQRVSAAKAEYETALRLDPEAAMPRVALGNLALASGDPVAAEANYREALRRDERAVDAHFGLGNLLARTERYSDAMSEYEAALHLDEHHFEARSNLANCELVTGRWREAIANYERVLVDRPNDENVRRNLQLARNLAAGRPVE